ncbi:hypothetical protein DFH94DRAFT_696350 [Russula ochroleuca]|uniref:Uncharacterized protein n=1 Tax=Russula ochroleuca TaxID=152965 RepID=A0A9P5JYS5_9AGAM|nr:hypothetical protein DFH94DRAFT_696350 [Russula ochroleuca]
MYTLIPNYSLAVYPIAYLPAAWLNPGHAVMEKEFLVLRHFHHAANGIYIWEYFTTLHYELDIIRGRCPYQWTIWIYSLMRGATLLAIIPDFVNLNVVTPINCQVWITFELISSYLVLFAASILICVRISSWDSTLQGCVVLNSEDKFSVTVSLIADIVLFVVILVGLRRLRRESRGSFDPGCLLWKQGIVWLLIATAAEVPPTVFINLNLDASFNIIMFQLPALIVMSIAATRMYRSPSEVVLGSTETSFLDMGSPQKRTRRVSKNHSAPVELSRTEVDVGAVYERYPPSQTITCIDGQPEGSSLNGRSIAEMMENRVSR